MSGSLLDAIRTGLVVKIGSDITGLKTGILGVVGELGKLDNATSTTNGKVKTNWLAIGTVVAGATAGITTALSALAQKSKDYDVELGRISSSTGIAVPELRNMALSMIDVTTSSDEALSILSAVSRAGVTTAADLKAAATAIDTMSDAWGQSADVVSGEAIPAYQAFNIELKDAAEHQDTLTFVQQKSRGTMSGFTTVVQALSQDIDKTNISLDDMAGTYTILSNKGMSARRMVSTLSDAFKDAEKTSSDYKKELVDLQDKLKDLQDIARDSSLSIQENEISQRQAERELAEMRAKGPEEGESTEEYNDRIAEQEIRIQRLKNEHTDLIEKIKENSDALQDNVYAQSKAQDGMNDTRTTIQKINDSLGITPSEYTAVQQSIEGMAGATKREADALEASKGPIDHITTAMDAYGLSVGTAVSGTADLIQILAGLSILSTGGGLAKIGGTIAAIKTALGLGGTAAIATDIVGVGVGDAGAFAAGADASLATGIGEAAGSGTVATACSMAGATIAAGIGAGLALGLGTVAVLIETGIMDGLAKAGQSLQSTISSIPFGNIGIRIVKLILAPFGLLGTVINDVVSAELKSVVHGQGFDLSNLGGDLSNVLHQTGIPGFATGGYMDHDGLAYLHAGEYVTPAAQVASGAVTGDTYYIQNPTFSSRDQIDYLFSLIDQRQAARIRQRGY